MNIYILKEHLLDVLNKTIGIIERKNSLPILSHVLLQASQNRLSVTASNIEIEIQAFCSLEQESNAEFTVNARKLLDIVKLIDDGTRIQLELINAMLHIKANKSRFTLGTLQTSDFPIIKSQDSILKFHIEENKLKGLLHRTSISMAQEDVRYYLKGMLFELRPHLLRTVSTDGHRLSLDEIDIGPIAIETNYQIIIPRKTILELSRILQTTDRTVGIDISSNHIRFYHPELNIISKLIDGRYPDYQRVIPNHIGNTLIIDRLQLKSAVQRSSVLSIDKYKAIRFEIKDNILKITGDNPEHEIAEEFLDVENFDAELSIGFNFAYLLEILNILDTQTISIGIAEDDSSTIIQSADGSGAQYIVMPMRI